MSNKFTEQLNNLRLLAGVPIKAEHGKSNKQPEQHLDEARRPNPSAENVVRAIKEVIDSIRQEMNTHPDPDTDEMLKDDMRQWQRLLHLVRKGEQQQAARMYHNMDPQTRDQAQAITNKGDMKAFDQYLNKKNTETAVSEAEEKSANRQDTTDQGDQSGMQDWKSFTVTLRTPDHGTRTEVVSARNKSEARRRARQQAPDGSHVSGTPEKMDEGVVNEEGAGGQSSYQITYNDGDGKKTMTVQAGNKAAARRKGPQGKRVVGVQELDTKNDQEMNEADDKKTFTVWGEVDIRQDTKNRKRDIQASNEEEAKQIMLNNLKQWARTNKQGSVNSARVTRVEQKEQTNEAHYYGTDYYSSHEEDDDAAINVVDYDQQGDDMDASTNSPQSTKTEVPQQTYNRGEESSENQEEEVKVPSDIKKELKDTIETLRHEAERLEQRGGSTAQHNRQFYNDTADAFEDLLGYLELGTIEGIKGAQTYASKLMGPMLHKLPTNTWKFIQRGGPNRSLKTYMGQVADDYPITGPRNSIDDNNWGS